MRPPSFEEFMKKQRTVPEGVGEGEVEEFKLEVCPTPGCGCEELHPKYDNELITGFSCEKGCLFTAKRNAFTGDLIYYKLEMFIESRFSDPVGIRGMKFSPLGEAYTDWY